MRRLLFITLVILASTLGGITVLGSLSSTTSAQPTSSPSVTVERTPKSSVAHGLVERVRMSWPWYLTRISGLIAAATFVLLMLSGVWVAYWSHFYLF